MLQMTLTLEMPKKACVDDQEGQMLMLLLGLRSEC